jgi:hypothetical protein
MRLKLLSAAGRNCAFGIFASLDAATRETSEQETQTAFKLKPWWWNLAQTLFRSKEKGLVEFVLRN